MKSFLELQNELLEDLKTLTTADNVEVIQRMKSSINNMTDTHKSAEDENTRLKDKIVSMVNGTIVSNEKPKDDLERQKTLDEIMLEQLNKIKK